MSILPFVGRAGHSLVLAMALAVWSGRPAVSQEITRGLDHIPVAVKDLGHAKADFEALGFVLKPGRPHANGLHNQHVKFRDGTEIELITASAAADSLTKEYVDWVKDGDGPVFLGLYAPDLDAMESRLSRLGYASDRKGDFISFPKSSALHHFFFARRQNSPTDRPDHFAHHNTAFSLYGAWLADASAEQHLDGLPAGAPVEGSVCAPFGTASKMLQLPEGEIVLLPARAQTASNRSIVAATVAVRNLDATRRVLNENHVPYRQMTGCARRSLWIEPAQAHGAVARVP